MSESRHAHSASLPAHHSDFQRLETRSWLFTVLFAIVFPVAVAALVYRLDPFEPVHLPAHELSRRALTAPARNEHMRRGSELLGEGLVEGPEDLAYDATTRVIYTGCADGWIKRVTVNESVADSVVQNWVNTGGRPLGLALGQNGELIVADANKGLLRVTSEEQVELLADEVEGLKFKLTNGVDIAHDGTIYFTDTSYKYSIKESFFDMLEGNPHGRFMSYNPATKKTTLLVHNLYFPNGVAVSPDQHFVVFCETILRRCRKYYIKGPKKGSIEKFCDDLPAMPDNIHYDGQGQYWIAIAKEGCCYCYKVCRRIHWEKNAGVLAVDLEGKPTAHYYDPEISLVSGGIKIGNHLYCGSIIYPFVIRVDVKQYPALPTT